ncbi:hypothetical protein TI39_contig374g00031 [Zymoseptoria brevis]|uniref:N-acetylgalactosaminide beta-1,3-galactosyltransferase n=1 Tax=Zymoseptoria brevis TaxID=1047168 RepID=A0A0F4GPB7_9PEZI|nr:hypothetical protein TI39_contig374g00031 [Zymoseptoria brevis]
MEETIGSHRVHDVYADVTEQERAEYPEFALYDAQRELQRRGDDTRSMSGGWDLAKYMNLAMLRKIRAMISDKKWFVFIDTDTFIDWDNLFTLLEHLDPDKRMYLGSPVWLPGLQFAHGGSAYALSSGALDALDYAAQSPQEPLYSQFGFNTTELCCGDEALARVLKSKGVSLKGYWPMFNGETPATLSFGKDLWCEPVVSLHHLGDNEMYHLWRWSEEWKVKTMNSSSEATPLQVSSMHLALFLYPLLATVQHVVKAAPLGRPSPGIARVPASLFDAVNETTHMQTTPAFVTHHRQVQTFSSPGIGNSKAGGTILPHDDDYLVYEISEDATFVQRRGDIRKRAPGYRGIGKMDCKFSPQACQNMCYYQNCMRTGRVMYTEPGHKANRAQAGVAVDKGTPCRTTPFSQKFWDPRGISAALDLETDEWPMNSFQRDDFSPAPTPPHKIALEIRGLSSQATFRVEPYLGSLIRGNRDDEAIRATLGYCKTPPNCANDGLQFHPTSLKLNPKGTSGKWPAKGRRYDNALHNTYKLTGESDEIRQFHIGLEISTLPGNDTVAARVFVMNSGVENELVRRNATSMPAASQFTLPVSGIMKKTLRVDRQAGCTAFTFTYGNPGHPTQGWKGMTFSSTNRGLSLYSLNSEGDYCLATVISTDITRLTCSFPGW